MPKGAVEGAGGKLGFEGFAPGDYDAMQLMRRPPKAAACCAHATALHLLQLGVLGTKRSSAGVFGAGPWCYLYPLMGQP